MIPGSRNASPPSDVQRSDFVDLISSTNFSLLWISFSCNALVQTYYLSATSELTSSVVHIHSFHFLIASLASGLHAAGGVMWGSVRDATDRLWPSMLVSSLGQAIVW